MLNFNQFNKKKEKYEVVKSISGLPMFVLPIPDSVNLTDEEPVQTKKTKVPTIVSRVCDFISDQFPNNKTEKKN
jgi:hypothetical protein